MKFIPFCIVTVMGLSACGSSNGGGGSGDQNTAGNTAVTASGMCTNAVLNDTETLKTASKNYLSILTENMADTMDEAKRAGALEKMQRSTDSLKSQIETFRSNYGDFACTYYSNGQMMRLDPAPLYKTLDDLNKPVEVKASPLGKDGDCKPEFVADYTEMKQKVQAPMSRMMAALGRMLSNLDTGLSSTADKEEVRDAAQSSLKIIEDFRGKYDTFACNVVDAQGNKKVVSSEEFDQSIRELHNQLDKLNRD